jgi:hypothetical protein
VRTVQGQTSQVGLVLPRGSARLRHCREAASLCERAAAHNAQPCSAHRPGQGEGHRQTAARLERWWAANRLDSIIQAPPGRRHKGAPPTPGGRFDLELTGSQSSNQPPTVGHVQSFQEAARELWHSCRAVQLAFKLRTRAPLHSGASPVRGGQLGHINTFLLCACLSAGAEEHCLWQ